MTSHQRIKVSEVGEVSIVEFVDTQVRDELLIQELAGELMSLAEKEHRHHLLLDFSGVDFFSSAALTKLLRLRKVVNSAGGSMKLCGLRPEIYYVFVVTNLTELFDIKEDRVEALATFSP